MNPRQMLKSEYRSRFPEGDKLSRIAKLIDLEAFRAILEPLFRNTGEGRPHIDAVLMMKVLVLQAWYGLADEMVETECKDRLTFMNFLGYPSSVPDSRTIWLFKERVAGAGKEKELWDELQRQLKKYRVAVKKGQMKDAVLIELGGWRLEGQHGPVAKVAPHTDFAQDSTVIEADPGLPTEEDVRRRREVEEEKKRRMKKLAGTKDDAAAPTTPVVTKTKPRGEKGEGHAEQGRCMDQEARQVILRIQAAHERRPCERVHRRAGGHNGVGQRRHGGSLKERGDLRER